MIPDDEFAGIERRIRRDMRTVVWDQKGIHEALIDRVHLLEEVKLLRKHAAQLRGGLPLQPLLDARTPDVARFRENPIVTFLLERGPHDMNSLAMRREFPDEARVQFASLIGYSYLGFCELSYVSASDRQLASEMVVEQALRA